MLDRRLDKKVLRLDEKRTEKLCFAVMLVLIVGITGLPYLRDELTGWFPDLMYHLLRIEAVKDALQGGVLLPRIYEMFFNGYGYGSPLFYPDIFLIYPAILRLLGFSPVMTWKLFALSITAVATCTTYFSFKYILRNWKFAMAGSYLLLLSQFYLADLINRLGISQYLAYIFLPLLFAGIYDFFVYEGKKVYLLGIAFVGLLLSHTNMTFIGILVTIFIFAVAILFRDCREKLLDRKRLFGLCVTALLSVLGVSYYIFPMFEQMAGGDFLYKTPWTYVSKNIQPFAEFFNFTGSFKTIALVGVGIPILMLLACRFLYGKAENRWAEIFYFMGIMLFLATTELFPWKLLDHSFFNMIQFPYRLYPYALITIILGMMLLLSEKCTECPNKMIGFIVVIALFFGFCQNHYLAPGVNADEITEEYLYANSNHVSMGEWLPSNYTDEVRGLEADGRVRTDYERLEFVRKAYNSFSFTVSEEDGDTYVVPLIYYKGYEAVLHTEDGEKIGLPVSMSEDALVQIINAQKQGGVIEVRYAGTAIQLASDMISLVVVLGVIAKAVWGRYRKKKDGAIAEKEISAA